ncbi:hypothetical protein H0H92_008619, partial [Tricholoma furcatifolium]
MSCTRSNDALIAQDLITVESVAPPRELLLSETLEHEPVSVGVLGGGEYEDEGALRRTIEGGAPPHARLEVELEQEEGDDSAEEDDGPGQVVEGRADRVGEEDDDDDEDSEDESSEEGVAQDDEDWGPEDMMPEPVDPEDWRRAWERRVWEQEELEREAREGSSTGREEAAAAALIAERVEGPGVDGMDEGAPDATGAGREAALHEARVEGETMDEGVDAAEFDATERVEGNEMDVAGTEDRVRQEMLVDQQSAGGEEAQGAAERSVNALDEVMDVDPSNEGGDVRVEKEDVVTPTEEEPAREGSTYDEETPARNVERVLKRPHKRRRTQNVNQFLDIEASESDADDEDDEDTVRVEEKEGFMAFINDEEEEESVEGADDNDIRSQLSVAWAEMSISRANDPAWQGVVDRARERARASTSNEAPQGEIVPTFWNIRVTRGREVAIAMIIGHYAMFSDVWLPIIRSVFARAGIPGYIVVETEKAEHAWSLCQGFTGVLDGPASVETPDALRWLTVGRYLPVPGSWVRMTRKFGRFYE